MRKEIEYAAQRFGVFADQVLEPAVHPLTAPLAAAVFQCPDRIPYAEAVDAPCEPVAVGWRWGPPWSTAWFRLTGRVPAEMAGQPVALRFSSGTEALLWNDGSPRQGFDANHDEVVLFEPAAGGEEVRLLVEAACNHHFGVGNIDWLEPEFNRRWAEPEPGRLERCELAVFDPVIWRLWRTYEFARRLLLLHNDDSPDGRRLQRALRRATVCLDDTNLHGAAAEASAILTEALHSAGPPRTRCFATGHAHIDTAWLWPIGETKRKCMRTFATALGLMERYPDFHFLCSQAQQYAWMEEASPELFERIAAQVRAGRWEAGGAMWVEPDCNVPSGESLVRQILLGTRYWQQKFGEHGRQRFLYLPDTFGFTAALPQIAALAGLDTFITNKISWNETNEFPHVNFRWRGIDGSELLAHCTPGHDYNSTNSPTELQRGEQNAARNDRGRTGVWLMPFGYGDGGGGPTDRIIYNAELARQCPGLPSVVLSRADEFCAELHRRRDDLKRDDQDLPVWDGELYLEYHRGTYTTQAWLKRANRRGEEALRVAEWLTFAGPTLDPRSATKAAAQLDEAWKLVLLNQFHDILPGSSITPVYDEARGQFERVREIHDALIEENVRRWSAQADTTGLREPMIVFNPCSAPRSSVIECEGELRFAEDVPVLGVRVLDRADAAAVQPVRVDGQTLSNGLIEATIDASGHVTSLMRAGSDRTTCAARPDGSRESLNQLVLYEDRPRAWDAWDIQAEYVEKSFPVEGPADDWRVVETDPLRTTIEVTRPLGKSSRITQRFILAAGSPRLDIHTRVDWHEDRRLLRALFPVDVRARRATYEIQFGHIERPTHHNTSWDRAMFEVCAHRWMDLSEPGFGVALLNDCKYGHSCHGNVMGLTLLRSPKYPDPQADMGAQEFTYSLMVHDGDWRAAGVDREAEALNTSLFARALAPAQRGALQGCWAPFTLKTEGASGVTISALKLEEPRASARADDPARLILRLAETHGGRGRATIDWNLSAKNVEPVDLLERPMELAGFAHDSETQRTTLALRPFQIVTLAARLT